MWLRIQEVRIQEVPLTWDLSCTLPLSQRPPLALWKSPFLATNQGKPRRKLAREKKTVVLDSRAASPWSLSVTVYIYGRHRKDWRVTLRGFLMKPCQSCLNAEHFVAPVIEGRKFLFIKFMGLDRKPNWNSFTNPRGKMIHLHRVGKSIFITFILPTPHFYSLPELLLFPPWCQVKPNLSRVYSRSHWILPTWLTQQRGKKGLLVLHCMGGATWSCCLEPREPACGCELQSATWRVEC